MQELSKSLMALNDDSDSEAETDALVLRDSSAC